jgi:hypothetical protein
MCLPEIFTVPRPARDALLFEHFICELTKESESSYLVG